MTNPSSGSARSRSFWPGLADKPLRGPESNHVGRPHTAADRSLTLLVEGARSAAATRSAGSNSRKCGSPASALISRGGCPPEPAHDHTRVGGPSARLRDYGWQANRTPSFPQASVEQAAAGESAG